MQGTIQAIHAERGFGFLRDTDIVRCPPEPLATLKVGMMVEFEAEPSSKGPRATKVRLVPQTNRS
jgi:cold shock CspA family protein